ncbi:hypothetical protein COV93_02725 [Candidatus Woesearchaeota archaeon CG11_big_fil_rev_8_21_14_0_20_43_8]|nr:MAG: hypothetical protein COV93_02725 [Candidatus Woesearchaeota archaeon CG11_big_fil_rev_8_21_14_0_20_43_8]PIO05317.1 MAG: hypothetical protein COT47_05335 [Candidatus Woesearchaeota archaeon CG08_land_8_20_14_0_20_43_7]
MSKEELDKEIKALNSKLDNLLKEDTEPKEEKHDEVSEPPHFEDFVQSGQTDMPSAPAPEFQTKKKHGIIDSILSLGKKKETPRLSADIKVKMIHVNEDEDFWNIPNPDETHEMHETQTPEVAVSVDDRPEDITQEIIVSDAISNEEQKVSIKTKNESVSPSQYFRLKNGSEIRNLNELFGAVKTMDDMDFSHHVNEVKNDFAVWVRDVLKENWLADDLSRTSSRVEFQNVLSAFLGFMGSDQNDESMDEEEKIKEDIDNLTVEGHDEKRHDDLEKEVRERLSVVEGESKNAENLLKEVKEKVKDEPDFDDIGPIGGSALDRLEEVREIEDKLTKEIRQLKELKKEIEHATAALKKQEKAAEEKALKLVERQEKISLHEDRQREKKEEIEEKKLELSKAKQDFKLEQERQKEKLQNEFEKVNHKITELGDREKDLSTEKHILKEKEAALKEREKDVEIRRKEFEKKEFELNDERQKIEFKEKELDRLQRDAKQKSKDLDRYKAEYMQKFEGLTKEREALQKLKFFLKEKIEEVETDKVEIKSIAERLTFEEDRINGKDLLVKRHTDDVQKSRLELSRQEEDIKSEEIKVMEAKKRLEIKEKEILLKSGDLSQLQQEYEEKLKRLDTLRAELLDYKKEFENIMPAYKQELTKYGNEWELRTKELRTNMNSIDVKKGIIQQNVDLLNKKEAEIIKTVHEIEKNVRLLDSKEKGVVKKISRLVELQNSVKEKESIMGKLKDSMDSREKHIASLEEKYSAELDRLEKERRKIAKAKELKTDITKYERREKMLKKKVDDLEKNYEKLSTDIMVKKEANKEKERELSELDARLKDKEKQLVRREQKMLDIREQLLREKTEISDDAFHLYLSEELDRLDKGGAGAITFDNEKDPSFQKVLSLLSEAKEAIKEKDVVASKKLYSLLQPAYEVLPDGDDKKRTYYDLLELKTDIELLALNKAD